MRKFYTFTAGSKVPHWMIEFTNRNREAYFLNKNSKFTFMVSCVVIRDSERVNTIMPVDNTHDGIVNIKKLSNAIIDIKGGYTLAEHGNTLTNKYPNGIPKKYVIDQSHMKQ